MGQVPEIKLMMMMMMMMMMIGPAGQLPEFRAKARS